MRIKVELHRSVVWFIKRDCNDQERYEFYEELDLIRTDIITNSEPIVEPKLSRYMLRFFRFGRNIAIFEMNRSRDEIRVRLCRKLKPRKPDPDPNA